MRSSIAAAGALPDPARPSRCTRARECLELPASTACIPVCSAPRPLCQLQHLITPTGPIQQNTDVARRWAPTGRERSPVMHFVGTFCRVLCLSLVRVCACVRYHVNDRVLQIRRKRLPDARASPRHLECLPDTRASPTVPDAAGVSQTPGRLPDTSSVSQTPGRLRYTLIGRPGDARV